MKYARVRFVCGFKRSDLVLQTPSAAGRSISVLSLANLLSFQVAQSQFLPIHTDSVTHCRGKPGHPRVRLCHLQVLFILQINVLAVRMEPSRLLVRIKQIPGLILYPETLYSKRYLIYSSVPPDELQRSDLKQPRQDTCTFPLKETTI